MKIKAYGLSDIGQVRKKNEDSFLIDKEKQLYIVADGIGGARGGEIASLLSVETVSDYLDNKKTKNPLDNLTKALELANKEILKKTKEDKKLIGMGTTNTTLLIQNETVYIAHVGDSRAYLFKNGELWQLTEDHSLLYEQEKKGLKHTANSENILTRSLGSAKNSHCDTLFRKVESGDTYLLCSDGLTAKLSHEGLTHILNHSKPEETTEKLINEANKLGGEDNITAILVRCD